MAVDVLSVMFPPGLQKDGRFRLGWRRAEPKAKNMRPIFFAAASRGITFLDSALRPNLRENYLRQRRAAWTF